MGRTLIFNITAPPLLRYDGVGLSQNEVHGKAEENGLDSLISKLVCMYLHPPERLVGDRVTFFLAVVFVEIHRRPRIASVEALCLRTRIEIFLDMLCACCRHFPGG